MPTYTNGYIPDSLLITFATGWSQNDGWWKHQLSASTYAKHLALVKRSPGGKLAITPGWGAYRPYAAQVLARRLYGNGAASPGTSSHGGFWEGRQTLAIDYHNWGAVYGWDQARFFADVRAVGLTPGMIMRSRGYPDEPWHVIDLDPWAPAPAGGTSSPFQTTTPTAPKEWDEMATEQQIKDIAEKMRDLYIITHASADADNGIYVVAPGHWRKIGGPANDIARVYVDGDGETVYSRATPLTTGGNWAVLVRYWEMFAPAGVRLDGSLATGVDGEMIAARAELAVREALKSLSVEFDEQAIATAVRDEFVKRPLS
jgi:hypothetical protein